MIVDHLTSRIHPTLLAIGATMLLVVGCSSPEAQSEPCEEGRSIECACPDGSTGAQICLDDGTWDECRCEPGDDQLDAGTDPETDTGTDTDTTDTGTDEDAGSDNGEPPYGDPDEYPARLWNYPEPDIDTTINLNDQGLSDGDLVDDYIDDHWDNGVRLEIEPGTYTFDGSSLHTKEIHDASLVGLGDPGDVEFELPEDCYPLYFRFAAEDAGTVLFKNIVQTGRTSSDASPGSGEKFRMEARDEDAEIVLEHVRRPDSTCGDGTRSTGIYFGSANHVGTMRLLWSHFEGYADNGAYVDGYGGEDVGRVIVAGGLYKNSDISNLRIGNDGSTVFNSTIVVDDMAPGREGETTNQRGLRIRHPEYDVDDNNLMIDGLDIHYEEGATGSPINFSSSAEGSTGTMRDVRITNHSGSAAIDGGGWDLNEQWEADNVQIGGDGNLDSDLEGDVTIDAETTPADTDPWWGEDI